MATITEDYVSFEIAKLLRKKGFNERCSYVWILDKANNPEDTDGVYKVSSPLFMEGESFVSNEDIDKVFKYSDEYYNKDAFLCPTLSVAMKWLREVHNFFIQITVDFSDGAYPMYDVSVINLAICTSIAVNGYDRYSYKEAVETAIKYCLEHLI